MHPQIELRFNGTIWTDPNIKLADLSILAVDQAQAPQDARRLGQERLMLLYDPASAERAGPKSSADWVNATRLIYVQGRAQFLDRWAKGAGITLAPQQASMKTDNAAAAMEVAASGGGVTATMSTYAAPYLASGRLVAPIGEGGSLTGTLCRAERKPPAFALGFNFHGLARRRVRALVPDIRSSPARDCDRGHLATLGGDAEGGVYGTIAGIAAIALHDFEEKTLAETGG